MTALLIGLALFFAIHSVRMVAPGVRDARIAAMGERGWKGVYAIVSLAGFALIVWGWMQYRQDAPEVFSPPDWGRHVNYLLTLVAFILFPAAELPAGRIKQAVGHPMILGTILWALGHLLANGDLASLLLFGSFLAYSAISRIAVAFRPAPDTTAPSLRSDVLAVVIGVALYAVMALYVHGWLFGVSPF